jgi:hypothetical protein
MAKKDRKKQRQENKELRKISREMGSAMDVKPTQKPSTGSPVSRALESTKKVAETLNTLDGVYLGQSKGSPISKPSSKLPPTPKDSTVGEEVNTGQTKVSKTPKKKPREKRPTGIEVVRNQSDKKALAKELGKEESVNVDVADAPSDSDNLGYNKDESQMIDAQKAAQSLAKATQANEVEESIQTVEEAGNNFNEEQEAIAKIDKDVEKGVISLEKAEMLKGLVGKIEGTVKQEKATATALEQAVSGEPTTQDPNQGVTVEALQNEEEAINQAMQNPEFSFSDPEFQNRAKRWLELYKETAKKNEREPAIEKLGLTDYFPTMQQPIAVGSYSRKTLGSGNIYAASGFTLPMGIVDARARAIQKAAKKKAKKNKKLIDSFDVTGAPQLQAEIDDLSNELIDKYYEATGGDLSILKDDRNPITMQFKKDLKKLKTFGMQTKELNKNITAIMDTITKGTEIEKMMIPEALKNKMLKYMEGGNGARELLADPEFYSAISQNVRSYRQLTHVADVWASKVTKNSYDKMYRADISESQAKDAWAKINSGDSALMYAGFKTVFDISKAEAAADQLIASNNNFSGVYGDEKQTKESLVSYMMSRMGEQQGMDKQSIYTGHGKNALGRARLDKEYQQIVTDLNNNTLNALKRVLPAMRAESDQHLYEDGERFVSWKTVLYGLRKQGVDAFLIERNKGVYHDDRVRTRTVGSNKEKPISFSSPQTFLNLGDGKEMTLKQFRKNAKAIQEKNQNETDPSKLQTLSPLALNVLSNPNFDEIGMKLRHTETQSLFTNIYGDEIKTYEDVTSDNIRQMTQLNYSGTIPNQVIAGMNQYGLVEKIYKSLNPETQGQTFANKAEYESYSPEERKKWRDITGEIIQKDAPVNVSVAERYGKIGEAAANTLYGSYSEQKAACR